MIPLLMPISGRTRPPIGLRLVGTHSAQGFGSSSAAYDPQGSLVGGMSASMQSQDILVVVCSNTGTSGALSSEGGRWITAANVTETAGSYNCQLIVGYQVLSDVTNTSANFTGLNSGLAYQFLSHVWRGVDLSTPLDVTVTTATHPNTSHPNPPSITPVTSGAIIIAAGAGTRATTGVINITTNGLDNEETGGTAPAGTTLAAMGSHVWTSGAYDPVAFTSSSSGAASNACSVTLALRPAT